MTDETRHAAADASVARIIHAMVTGGIPSIDGVVRMARAVAVAEETHCFASSAGYPNAALLEQILSRMPMPSCAGVDGGEVTVHMRRGGVDQGG
jgi:hypothetical protein